MARSIQSVTRTLDVLELFNPSDPELSLKEVSATLNLAKSTVHGLMSTLVSRGYLQQNPANQKYRLGLKNMELGRNVELSLDFRRIAFPLLEKLAGLVKETIHLVLWNGNDAVYIEKINGSGALIMSSQVGKKARLHCTGVGKAVLAYLDENTQNRMLAEAEFAPHTPHTITDAEALKTQLHLIRERGYSEDNEEIEVGLMCIASPIFNYTSKVVGSISCSGPKQRMEEKSNMQNLPDLVKRTAQEISKELGYSVGSKISVP
jgi:IclR family KDG regulon transcriptional repressor